MKIVLISPAGAMHRYSGNFGKSLHYAPLTFTTLASYSPPGMNITYEIYDETVDKIPLDIEADLIGFTAITGTAPRVYQFADYFRRKGIKVVIGGVHPSILPEEAKNHCDSVVIGNAENSWPQIIKDLLNNNLKDFYKPSDIIHSSWSEPKRELLKKSEFIVYKLLVARSNLG